MSCRCSSLALSVLLIAGLAAAHPQSRSQKLTPQQQQLILRQRQQQGSQTAPIGSLDRLPENQSITGITSVQLQRFLANENSVKIITDCFIAPRQCTSKQSMNLINQVRSLGIGGRCKTCTPQQQENLGKMIYDFVWVYQNKYPDHWRRVLPHLGTLITAIPNY